MISVSEPLIAKNAKKYVLDCLSSGWISSRGPYVSRFEERFAAFLGVEYGVATTSGTAALHLALVALGIGKGDEVIVPAFTMIAPVFAVVYTGAKPVLVDSESDTWNIDVSQVEKKITKKTKAIIAVHIYGHPVNMDPLVKLAKKHGFFLVEDGAEALGAEYKGRKVGTFGDVSCFSFYANKIVTTGEGGMVVTDDERLAQRLRSLKDMAHSSKKRFVHTEIGFTYRMTNMQAALGLAQLEEIEKFITKKRWMAKGYNRGLRGITGLTLPIEKPWAKHSYWMYGVLVGKEFGLSKKKIREKLLEKQIDTRDFFIPMHKQPALKKLGLFKNERYPVAEDISRRGFYLPSGLGITEEQIKFVCRAAKEIISNC